MGITRRQAVRQIMGGGVATVGVALAPSARAQQPAPPSLAVIEALDVSPYDPAITKLIWSIDPEPRYIPPDGQMPVGFFEGSRRLLEDHSNGEFRSGTTTQTRSIELVGQEQREYLALEDGQVVNAFSVAVIVTRPAHFQLVCALGFPQDATDQEKKAWDALIQKYQAVAAAAPDDNVPLLEDIVLPEAQQQGLNPARVVVVMRMEVLAVGTRKAQNDPYAQTQGVFAGSTQGKIARIKPDGTTEMVSLKTGLASRHLSYQLLSATVLDQPPPQTSFNSPMFVDTNPNASIDRVADAVAERYAKGVNCKLDFSQGVTHEVMTLLRYPEFKVEWQRVTIHIRIRWRFIRFSASITVLWPRVYTRFSDLVLIAWSRWPSGAVAAVAQRVIEHCIIKAAIIGGVVGVVMSNPAAAWTAFSGAFESCLKDQAFTFVKCMIPGLAVKRVVGNWS